MERTGTRFPCERYVLSGSSPASRGGRGGVERAIRSRNDGTSRPAPKAAAPTASGRAFFVSHLIVTPVNGLQACRLDSWHGESSCRTIVVKRQLSTVDLLARASMKNAANCDT